MSWVWICAPSDNFKVKLVLQIWFQLLNCHLWQTAQCTLHTVPAPAPATAPAPPHASVHFILHNEHCTPHVYTAYCIFITSHCTELKVGLAGLSKIFSLPIGRGSSWLTDSWQGILLLLLLLQGILLPLVGLFGLAGNIISVAVLSARWGNTVIYLIYIILISYKWCPLSIYYNCIVYNKCYQ